MGPRKLLIADTNEDYLANLTDALQSHFSLRVCTSGLDALGCIRREPPDILLMDPMLPELDGLTLLKILHTENLHPAVLLVTRLSSDYILDQTEHLRIDYILQKPCLIPVILEHLLSIRHFLDHKPPVPSLGIPAQEIVDELGISPEYDGYDCMAPAICLLLQGHKKSLTKELYPAVGKICGYSASSVERNIRNAIEATWPQRNRAVWDRYFPDCRRRPSNGAFLRRLAKELHARLE